MQLNILFSIVINIVSYSQSQDTDAPEESPVILINSTLFVLVARGYDLTLECYASGSPPPRIVWRRKDNLPFSVGGPMGSSFRGNILKIKGVRKADAGVYVCDAGNGVGRSVSHSVPVHVGFAPEVTAECHVAYQALGHDQELSCRVEAYPPTVLNWLKDDKYIVDGPHYTMKIMSTDVKIETSTIRIKSIEKEHFGNYTCMATNGLGSTRVQVRLEESDLPVCPPACPTIPTPRAE